MSANGSTESFVDKSASTPTAPATTAKKPRGTVTKDAEVVAIAKIGNILASLDEASRNRVLRYFAEKFAHVLEG